MIFDESSFDLGEKFLEHYGVKGMHWGIRKEEELVGREKGQQADTEDEVYSRQLEAKYGKDSMKDLPPTPHEQRPGWNRLTPEQKRIVKVGGGFLLGALAAAGVGYFGYKVGGEVVKQFAAERAENARLDADPRAAKLVRDVGEAWREAREIQDSILVAEKGPQKGTGLATHWDNGVVIAAGSIIQRMTTEKETTIRPGGFFGAHEQSDVDRYVAQLPTWWARWGYDNDSGYLTQLKAKREIKAPSGKESVKLLADVLDSDEYSWILPYPIRELPAGPTRDKALFGLALQNFATDHGGGFSGSWANGADKDPMVRQFFRRAKESGYLGLIDFNDSGRLARTPMRFIDGNAFDIVGNIPVSFDDIQKMKASLPDLVMSALGFGEVFLAHYGKKGMHWGIRKALPNGGAKFWANAATRTVAKGKKPKSPYLGVVGGYGRAAGLGLKKHPAFAVAGGAAVAALVAGSVFSKYRKKKIATMPPASSVDTRGSIFVTRSFTLNNQPVTMNSIQSYRLWPHSQLQS